MANYGFGSLTYTIRNNKKYWTCRVYVGEDLEGNQIRKSFSGYNKSEVIEKMKKLKFLQTFQPFIIVEMKH